MHSLCKDDQLDLIQLFFRTGNTRLCLHIQRENQLLQILSGQRIAPGVFVESKHNDVLVAHRCLCCSVAP